MAKPILLVMKTDILSELLTDFFAQLGYEVVQGMDGREAMQLIDESPDGYTLICCNLMLGYFDGTEVLERVRQNPLSEFLPFLLLCGLSPVVSPEELYSRSGFEGFLSENKRNAVVIRGSDPPEHVCEQMRFVLEIMLSSLPSITPNPENLSHWISHGWLKDSEIGDFGEIRFTNSGTLL